MAQRKGSTYGWASIRSFIRQAAVPWISVFDPAITTSATQGYYVAYLFHVSEPLVHLSLNQGTTAVREEFRERTREILRDRADLM
jgi:5-methylcytosine-specific restriction enzyme A